MAEDATDRPGGDSSSDSERVLEGSLTTTTPTRWWSSPAVVFLGMLALSIIIVVDLFLIFGSPRTSDAGATRRPEARRFSNILEPYATMPVLAGELEGIDAGPRTHEFGDDGVDDEPRKARPSKRYATVQQAMAGSCSTSSVEGLSRQIIAQAACIDDKAFVRVPARPNLVTGSHVFLYLEASARDRLLLTLDAHRDRTMTVNSALRTVAQQYLLWRWSTSKRCGIELATPPGESNHETGLALDITEAPKWRPALEAQGFQWLGAIDKVHFDFKGGSAARRNVDVMAFQQLWNRNHPDDTIAETGEYGPATEQRLVKSPAGGFVNGPRCNDTRGGGDRVGSSRVLAH